MKKMLLLLLLIPLFVFCQKDKKIEITQQQVDELYASLPKVDGEYEFTEVVSLDSSFTKDALYRNAKLFFAEVFKSSKDVLQYDDKEQGKVIGKGNISLTESQSSFLVYFTKTRHINFTLEIFCKDGKYKYRLHGISTDYNLEAQGGTSPPNYSNGTQSISETYLSCNKGTTKKLDRKLFYDSIIELKSTCEQIKSYMKKKESSDF